MTSTAVLLLPIAVTFIGLTIRDIARDMRGLRERRPSQHQPSTSDLGTRARHTR